MRTVLQKTHWLPIKNWDESSDKLSVGGIMKRISDLLIFLILGFVFISGCAGMQRSTASGYAHRDSDPNMNALDRRTEQRDRSAREMGFKSSDDLTDNQAEAVDRRITLSKAERALEGKREREQYFKNKPYMKNDRERLDFLNQDSFEARARWLNSKNIGGPTTAHPSEIQALVDINDITLGMTKQAVRDSWGEPELVEVAGNPMYGNERWHYTEQTSSTEGYHTQHRMVYFDAGRVSGWESK
jgi:hypothetical protein